MNKFRKIELGLLGVFFLFITIQLYDIPVLGVLLINILGLFAFWLFAFIQTKKIDSPGFSRKNITEKFLILFLLLFVTLNISAVAHTSVFIFLALLILSFYYIINGIVKWAKQSKEWVNGVERILLGLILLGFMCRFMSWPLSGILRIFPLLMLFVLMSFYSIFSAVKLGIDKQRSLGASVMIVHAAIAFSILFMLFDAMFWPGKTGLFMLYSVVMIVAISFYLFRYFSTDKTLLNVGSLSIVYNTSRRLIIYNVLALFLLFLSRRQFERFQFGNRPELIEAVINCTSSTDDNERAMGCYEAERLDSLYRAGSYPEEN
jgi:hypothetical protein